MKKFYYVLFISTFLSISNFVKAQDSYQAGYAVLNDGTRVSGLISVFENQPWYNERRIVIKDSVTVAANPNGNVEAKKYLADDLQYYVVGQRKYVKVHYVDLQNLQVKSLGSNNHMMEVLAVGKINAYRFYAYPQDVYATLDQSPGALERQIKAVEDDRLEHWKMLFQKDDDKLRDLFQEDMQKYFSDNSDVLQKYQQGGYGNEPISTKKGLAARMISMAKQATYKHMGWETQLAAIEDYNQKSAAK